MNSLNKLDQLSDPESDMVRYDLCLENNWADINNIPIPHILIVKIGGSSSMMHGHGSDGRWSISRFGPDISSSGPMHRDQHFHMSEMSQSGYDHCKYRSCSGT